MNKSLNEIVDEMEKRGSSLNTDEVISKSEEIIKKDFSLEEALMSLASNVKGLTEDFLHSKNNQGVSLLAGISSCIYLPDFKNNGEYKLKLIGGSRDRNIDLAINNDTLFDVASISKLYTLLLLFRLEQLGLIDLNSKIVDLNPDFPNLEDFTFNDLIRLHGDLYTNGRIDDATSYEEAYERLKSTYLKSNTREENKYTDIGAIIMSKTLERVISREMGKEMNYSEIMDEFLLKPLGLEHTMFNPHHSNTAGNGNMEGIVHDPKARILGGAVGSAGIFTTSDDLARLARNIYTLTYINKDYVSRLGEITFPDSRQSMKGNLGIYVKHPKGLDATYTPSEFSTGSFSHQGWTGSVATFDPNNMIHQNFLVNAIYKNEDPSMVRNDKPVGFGAAFDEYLAQVTQNTILMLVVKEYYNRYCNVKENIDETVQVR